MMKHITMFILLLLMACAEAPEEVYENPLDIEFITEEGIETPALMFFPDEININTCLLYTSPSPRDRTRSRMPSSA